MNSIYSNALVNSTIHSFPKLIKTKYNLMRGIWIITTILSIGFCSWLIFQSINDYLNYEVVTKIRVFNEKESEFPMVTLCNADPFTSYKMRELVKSFHNLTDDNLNQMDFYKSSQVLEYLITNLTFEQQAEFYSDVTINCFFDLAPCNKSEMFAFVDPIYGICTKFNSGFDSTGRPIPIKKSAAAGFYNGFVYQYIVGNQYNKKPSSLILAKGKLI
jgi:hypothetical protein